MEEEYSIDEILKAVNELQSSNKEKKIDTIVIIVFYKSLKLISL